MGLSFKRKGLIWNVKGGGEGGLELLLAGAAKIVVVVKWKQIWALNPLLVNSKLLLQFVFSENMWAQVKIHMNLILTNLYSFVFVEIPPKMYVGFLCQVSAVHSSYKKELLSQLKCTRCSLNVELN